MHIYIAESSSSSIAELKGHEHVANAVTVGINTFLYLLLVPSARNPGADLRGGCRECAPPPPDDLRFSNATGVVRPFTSQLRHSLVVQPLLKKFLGPPLKSDFEIRLFNMETAN